ncbi:MAG: hypothetical protein IPN79_01765 [Saprospiraceae bacterium]|nr:hypothetical protein [Saprospiraceae bacterium]
MLRPSDNLDLLLVGDIESQINEQPFNQMYRLILNSKMGQNWDNRLSAAAYNTLSPFLTSSVYLMESTVISINSVNSQDTGDKSTEPVADKEIIGGKQEKTMALQEEYSSFSSEYTDSVTQIVNISSQTETKEVDNKPEDSNTENSVQQVETSSANINKKKKKKKKNKILITALSDFSSWLLSQKQIAKQNNFNINISNKDKVKLSAQKSIAPSDNIASESLAKILQMQGHYLKAKNMYLKLIQKFPDQTDKYNSAITELNILLEKAD